MKVERFNKFRNVHFIADYHKFTCVPLRFAIRNRSNFLEVENVTVMSVITKQLYFVWCYGVCP